MSLDAGKTGRQRDELTRRQIRIDVRIFREKSDPGHDGRIRRSHAQNLNRPRRRRDEPHERLDGRRLASPIRPKKAEGLAPMDVERHAANGFNLATAHGLPECLHQAGRSQHHLGHDLVSSPFPYSCSLY